MPDFVVCFVPGTQQLTAIVGPNLNGSFTSSDGDTANKAAAVLQQRDGKYVALPLLGAIPASFTTDTGVANSNLKFTALAAGTGGNVIRFRYVIAGNNTALSVSVAGSDITINLATSAGGAATSTANQIMAAVAASAPASALVIASLAPGNDGTAVPSTAIPFVNLGGGTVGAAVASQVVVALAGTSNPTTF